MNGERCVVLRSSPRVWPRTTVVREFEGRAVWPVGLTAREEGTSPTSLAGQSVLRPDSSRLVGTHECAVAGAKKKLGVHQRTEQRIARRTIETPEPLRLRCRQPQSRHFDVLALNASQYVLKRLLCWHVAPPVPDFSNGHI